MPPKYGVMGKKKKKIKLTEMVTSDFLQGNLNYYMAT